MYTNMIIFGQNLMEESAQAFRPLGSLIIQIGLHSLTILKMNRPKIELARLG